MKKFFDKLDQIIELLQQQNLQKKELLTFEEACQYLGFKQSYFYKITANGEVPCYAPTGRKLLFKRSELTEWALRNRRASQQELEEQATNYLTLNQSR